MGYKTCTHTYDSGRACKSAAATGREYCGYHLHYRGRQMRRAQYRARHQTFNIILPPLDSLCSIHSALSQVAEALAADMIDPRRAQGLLKALRFAKENLRDGLKEDNAHWHDTPYLTEDAVAYDSFEAEYGLPEGIDLSIPPEVAFPPPEPGETSGAPPLSRSDRVGDVSVAGWPIPPSFGGVGLSSDLSPMPSAGACEHGPDCPELIIRADHPVTPEAIEILEVAETYGSDAAARRGGQLSRNRQRRLQTSNRKRYAAIALERNLRLAAEKLATQKLAAEKAATQIEAAQGAQPEVPDTKKPPARAVPEPAPATQQEAKSIA